MVSMPELREKLALTSKAMARTTPLATSASGVSALSTLRSSAIMLDYKEEFLVMSSCGSSLFPS